MRFAIHVTMGCHYECQYACSNTRHYVCCATILVTTGLKTSLYVSLHSCHYDLITPSLWVSFMVSLWMSLYVSRHLCHYDLITLSLWVSFMVSLWMSLYVSRHLCHYDVITLSLWVSFMVSLWMVLSVSLCVG